MHKALYRQDLSLEAAQAQIASISQAQAQCEPDVRMMTDFLKQTSAQRGIVR
jgi:UDP-N-acetylglucosamine acyltransferase